jgi:hypothetical protein
MPKPQNMRCQRDIVVISHAEESQAHILMTQRGEFPFGHECFTPVAPFLSLPVF